MKLSLSLLALLVTLNSFAQKHYAIEFIDKSSDRIEHFIQNPEEMLSPRAIDRRQTLNISFDAIDVPIDSSLIIQCKETGAEIISTSKWLNTIFVYATEEQKTQLEGLAFVKNIRSLETDNSNKRRRQTPIDYSKKRSSYGDSEVFVTQIKTDFLHNKGFSGNGIQIAVLDAGFTGVDTTDPFQELRDRNGILGTYNFVKDTKDVYRDNQHGTMVLGTMAVNKPDTYIGTAYNAEYWLFTTEDVGSETPKEEFNWIKAIEFADSVGVDVVNSSLGYYDFDPPFKSYTYENMDGKTTFITKAASIGGQKGLLVIISAGNEGDKDWTYIGAPADAENIITVGAVNSSGHIGAFSSFGPSADGRIKPNVAAMGVSVPVYDQNGYLSPKSGTSFSSPIMAGSVACLRQAFPNVSVATFIDAIQQSANNASNPDDRVGYGVANLEGAYYNIKDRLNIDSYYPTKMRVSPNPVSNTIIIDGVGNKLQFYNIIDISGRLIMSGSSNLKFGIDVSDLNKGYYLISIDGNKKISLPFIKK